MKDPNLAEVLRQVEETITEWNRQAAELRRSTEELLRVEVTAERKSARAIRCAWTPAPGRRRVAGGV
ncbi:hypothetical protein [Methylobacterium nodulans]|uniref:Uncharacterized protein n=1 Tax=Methylobacterium nodulans (strain LMG 21967 / CNCM I-2342 / ORS 2060) TaxID=460265 RepID=B8IKW9_METNO|nr:hypothetical protein [Methylobacterium nodulans]ACL58157.1 hypothetical protein Mnod_3232 [Methylobacterium nodulans ORS 2060]ACL63202.1 hypothetical protein Mnod_8230 [Methylobacterium nodulans ORS 2060]